MRNPKMPRRSAALDASKGYHRRWIEAGSGSPLAQMRVALDAAAEWRRSQACPSAAAMQAAFDAYMTATRESPIWADLLKAAYAIDFPRRARSPSGLEIKEQQKDDKK